MDVAVGVGRAVVQDEARPALRGLAQPAIEVDLVPSARRSSRLALRQAGAHREIGLRQEQRLGIVALLRGGGLDGLVVHRSNQSGGFGSEERRSARSEHGTGGSTRTSRERSAQAKAGPIIRRARIGAIRLEEGARHGHGDVSLAAACRRIKPELSADQRRRPRPANVGQQRPRAARVLLHAARRAPRRSRNAPRRGSSRRTRPQRCGRRGRRRSRTGGPRAAARHCRRSGGGRSSRRRRRASPGATAARTA